ncbi:MAG: hypothetical protein ABI611_17670 [Solirubrobacteraceae bacterium]
MAVLLAAAGCGGGGLSGTQRDQLAARVDQAREAAAARDADGVRRALVAFRASVRAARDRDEISSDDAGRLLTGALQASRRVRAEITPAPTPATPAPAATVAPAPPAHGKKPKKDKGKAKGHGKR